MSGRDVTVHTERPVQAEQVTSLVQLALEKGTPVEVLERLVALQERITERNARSAFFEAMAAFHDECPPIHKTRENTQFKVSRNGVSRHARYAPLEEITRTAQPVAAKHGLIWKWNTQVDGDLMHVTCRVTHVAGHFEETTVSMPHESRAGSSPQQKFGSTQTYGMRYSLIAALGITTADDDVDGSGTDVEPEPITDEQAADLDSLIDEVGADKAAFLKWLGVDALVDIPAHDFDRALRALERKRAS